jgi:hypothetical protein
MGRLRASRAGTGQKEPHRQTVYFGTQCDFQCALAQRGWVALNEDGWHWDHSLFTCSLLFVFSQQSLAENTECWNGFAWIGRVRYYLSPAVWWLIAALFVSNGRVFCLQLGGLRLADQKPWEHKTWPPFGPPLRAGLPGGHFGLPNGAPFCTLFRYHLVLSTATRRLQLLRPTAAMRL